MLSANVLSQILYVSDPGNNAVNAFSITEATGVLSVVPGSPFSLGDRPGAPAGLAVSGNLLYVGNTDGPITGFAIGKLGALSPLPGLPIPAGVAPSGLLVVPLPATGAAKFLYAADFADPAGGIWAFTISSSGALVTVPGSPFPTVLSGGPSGMEWSGNTLYVALKSAGSVAAFSISPTGALAPISGSPFAAGGGASSLAVAYGFLLAMNSSDKTISSYIIGPGTGILHPVAGSPFAKGAGSGEISFSLSGILYMSDAQSEDIAAFTVDSTKGLVTAIGGSPFPVSGGPLALAVVSYPASDAP
jgi:6-phosphogluconolactonase